MKRNIGGSLSTDSKYKYNYIHNLILFIIRFYDDLEYNQDNENQNTENNNENKNTISNILISPMHNVPVNATKGLRNSITINNVNNFKNNNLKELTQENTV